MVMPRYYRNVFNDVAMILCEARENFEMDARASPEEVIAFSENEFAEMFAHDNFRFEPHHFFAAAAMD